MAWTGDFFAKHPVFTTKEFTEAQRQRGEVSESAAQELLGHWRRRGRIRRIRRGLYIDAERDYHAELPFLLAAKATDDAVLAMHTAIGAHLGIRSYSDEWPYFFNTAGRTRPFHWDQDFFVPVVTDFLTMIDTVSVSIAGIPVSVSRLERAFVDSLDRLDELGWVDTWHLLEQIPRGAIDWKRLTDCALSRGNSTLIGKLGFFLDRHRHSMRVDLDALWRLREKVPSRSRRVHASPNEPERLVPDWNIVVPESVWRKDFDYQDPLTAFRRWLPPRPE
jgi:predicted transcriptional regulator of viral defense system